MWALYLPIALEWYNTYQNSIHNAILISYSRVLQHAFKTLTFNDKEDGVMEILGNAKDGRLDI